MTITTIAANAASGDNTTTHVISATVVAGALTELVDYIVNLAHLPPFPDAVTMVLSTVLASVIMQWLPIGKSN